MCWPKQWGLRSPPPMISVSSWWVGATTTFARCLDALWTQPTRAGADQSRARVCEAQRAIEDDCAEDEKRCAAMELSIESVIQRRPEPERVWQADYCSWSFCSRFDPGSSTNLRALLFRLFICGRWPGRGGTSRAGSTVCAWPSRQRRGPSGASRSEAREWVLTPVLPRAIPPAGRGDRPP
jgi:hypothetical protein